MPKIMEKLYLVKLFLKAFFRKENLFKGYGLETTQGRATWTFIAGAVIYHLLGFYAIAAFVGADALNALWIGMQKNGYYEDPSQIVEGSP
jgi:hypothetical protein